VEIARALSKQARVLIMDEPTSSLGRAETEHLLKLISGLKRDGIAVLYITHKFEELADLADEIAVMRDGRLLVQAPYHAMTHRQIVSLMVGRETQEPIQGARSAITGIALTVQSLTVRHPTRSHDELVKGVSLEVGCGEIVGLFGLVGAGRTEFLEALFGVHGRRVTGSIRVNGLPVSPKCPADAVRAGLGFVPEDRKQQGLILGMSSRENAALACIGMQGGGPGFLTARTEAALTRPLLQRLGLRAASLDEPVRSLSGGNQQKVVLAKWLATQPKVLLLDEPTRGIDVNARSEFYEFIRGLAAQGMAVLFASSEIPEVIHLADRIVVFSEGARTAEFSRGAGTPERLLAAALPRQLRGAA
jgi:ribose transport system ATP-binding protein